VQENPTKSAQLVGSLRGVHETKSFKLSKEYFHGDVNICHKDLISMVMAWWGAVKEFWLPDGILFVVEF